MTMSSTPSRSWSVDAFVQAENNCPQTEDQDESESSLSEVQLRELYDEEEIERFMRLFSAYVNEVQILETPPNTSSGRNLSTASAASSSDESEWTAFQSKTDGDDDLPPTIDLVTSSKSTISSSLSEEIARQYLAPLLPAPRLPSPPFTFGRLRLALERLYLIALPTYSPLFNNLKKLATWEEPLTSSIYCTIYWTLWWQNFLLPALVGRILFALLRRRIFPYPSLSDLLRHRAEVQQADAFGAHVTARLSSTSSVMTEMWRLFRLLDKIKVKKAAKGKEKSRISSDSKPDNRPQDDTSVLDDPDDKYEADLKRLALYFLDQVVDLHERIRNIFIWRKPAASWRYGMILFLLFLTSFLPAKYISKFLFLTFGVLFWHVIPILAALPPSDVERILLPFQDVPTDAEYAMQLISERVSAGLEVNPSKTHRKKRQHMNDTVLRGANMSKDFTGPSVTSLNTIESKQKALPATSSSGDTKKSALGKGHPILEVWPPRHPLLAAALSIAQPQANTETHTYPCQHSSSPGLITLTYRAFFFTPLISQNAKLIIPLSAVKGVKKTGLLKGLFIRWSDPPDDKEEKFIWIRGRDELFARLVGTEGRKWIKV